MSKYSWSKTNSPNEKVITQSAESIVQKLEQKKSPKKTCQCTCECKSKLSVPQLTDIDTKVIQPCEQEIDKIENLVQDKINGIKLQITNQIQNEIESIIMPFVKDTISKFETELQAKIDNEYQNVKEKVETEIQKLSQNFNLSSVEKAIVTFAENLLLPILESKFSSVALLMEQKMTLTDDEKETLNSKIILKQ